MGEPDLVSPEPNADHSLPFHLAMWLAGLPPAVVKSPPAYQSEPETASDVTSLFIPGPNADQALPFHLAMWLAGLPPAVVNPPPAYKSEPEIASA